MQFPKPNHPVCLDQGSTSAIGSSSNKRSRTPSQRNSESWDCCQREYHSVPYFPVGPPMPRPWGPLPMMFPICPLWVGWYRPWLCYQCTFTWNGQDQLEVLVMVATMQETTVMEVSANTRTGGARDSKTGLSKIPNRIVRFPQRGQKLLDSSSSSGFTSQSLLLMVQRVVSTR
jgi:hypothetical protein